MHATGAVTTSGIQGAAQTRKNNSLKIIVLVNSVIIGDVIVMKTVTVI